jgi:hypothetical protein
MYINGDVDRNGIWQLPNMADKTNRIKYFIYIFFFNIIFLRAVKTETPPLPKIYNNKQFENIIYGDFRYKTENYYFFLYLTNHVLINYIWFYFTNTVQ